MRRQRRWRRAERMEKQCIDEPKSTINHIMVYAPTAHNGIVYASPPLAARSTVWLGHSAPLIPRQNSATFCQPWSRSCGTMLRHLCRCKALIRTCIRLKSAT
jgi:hypothetical protein